MKIIFLKKILTSDYGFQKYSLEKKLSNFHYAPTLSCHLFNEMSSLEFTMLYVRFESFKVQFLFLFKNNQTKPNQIKQN